MMRAGDKKGYPIIDIGQGLIPPDGSLVYDASSNVTNFKPHMTKPHPEIPFLRSASLSAAIEYVRNEGHPPVQVRVAVLRYGRDYRQN